MAPDSNRSEIKHAHLLRHARIPLLLALLIAAFLVLRVPIHELSHRQAKADSSPQVSASADSQQADDPVAESPVDGLPEQDEPANEVVEIADAEIEDVGEPTEHAELVAVDANHEPHNSPELQGSVVDLQDGSDQLTDEEIALRDLKRLKETASFLLDWLQDYASEHATE